MIFATCCLGAVTARPAEGVVLAPGFQDKVVFSGLDQPTTLRFAPDGRIFVAEKSGKVLVFSGLGDSTPEQFVDLSKLVYDHGDRGLLALALDPHFEEGKPYVYALYTYDHILGKTLADGEEGQVPRWGDPANPAGDSCPKPPDAKSDDCPVSGRLVRLTADGNHAKLGPFGEVEEKVLVEDWCQQYSSHSIGDLQFDSRGALYASGGDGASFYDVDFGQTGWPNLNQCGDPENPVGVANTVPGAEGGALRSQDLRTAGDPVGLDGSIIRIDPETGEGLPGNPLFGSSSQNARRIIAYGLRNPFRFALDEENGEIYTGDVGWNTWEEINRVPMLPDAPANSGWPCYEGPERNPSYERLGLYICRGPYSSPGSTVEPFFYYNHFGGVIPEDECSGGNGSAMSGIALYPGSGPFPAAYRHALFFADSVRSCIFVAPVGADGRPDTSRIANFLWDGGQYAGVDLQIGPEGNLYYVAIFDSEGDGKIHQISYEPGVPVAKISASPRWGPLNLPAGLKIQFDGSQSSDPDSEALIYSWDLNGDGVFGDSTNVSPSFTYKTVENVTVSLRVEDTTGKTSVASKLVYPGDTPPTVKITQPSPSLTWGAGQQIQFAGVASDKEEGTLPKSNLSWITRVLHCPAVACHEHPLQSFTGVSSGEVEAPDHDYPSHLKLILGATDSRGLTATEAVQIDPRPVSLHLASDPPGVSLGAGAQSAAAPFDVTVIEGGTITLAAPENVTAGTRSMRFEGWSDGGDRVHTIVADAPANYTAVYAGPEEPVPNVPDRLPHTRLLKHPPKRTARASARFAFAADQPGSRFECGLDRAPFKPCRSPRAYMRLGPGRHLFKVRAVNPGGLLERQPVAFAWRILRRRG